MQQPRLEPVGSIEYLVMWRGYGAEGNTWEPAENIFDAALIDDFEKREAELEAMTPEVIFVGDDMLERASEVHSLGFRRPTDSLFHELSIFVFRRSLH